MAGDFSRRTFLVEKRYAAVLAQQGRVLADADVNEQLDIHQHREQTEALDTIGACGVPKQTDGFRIQATPSADDLSISAGRIYVDGLLCELDSTPVALFFPPSFSKLQAQVASLQVDGLSFEVGQRVQISALDKPASALLRVEAIDSKTQILTFDADISTYKASNTPVIRRITTYITQPNLPSPELVGPSSSPPGFETLDLEDGRYIAYLKVWQREVNALDDPHIKEIALGGPDTATRLQNVWQVGLLQVSIGLSGPSACNGFYPEWSALVTATTGRMNAQAVATNDAALPCQLPPQSGYRRLENQLYRVQIHTGGGPGQATFKWSRENASIETGIQVSGSTIVADDLGKDDVLGFKGGDWVEIVDDSSTLKEQPYDLLQINPPDPASRQVTTSSPIGIFSGRSGLKMRRWDQRGASTGKAGILLSTQWIDLEDGVQVQFSAGQYRSGDYWLIPARTATADIEWPPYELPNLKPIPQSPLGIHRHYCRLAVLTVAGGAITQIDDCRKLFPPISAITASDVSYKSSGCETLAPATTVGEALDLLCANSSGTCTLSAVPNQSLQALFDSIPAGGDAQVCFPAGTYNLNSRVVIKNKGKLKIIGAGTGTILVAAKDETTLSFLNCASVHVSHLHAEGSIAVRGPGTAAHLGGALAFSDCGDVTVESVSAKCAGGPERAACCISVLNTANLADARLGTPSARIVGCQLAVGHLQNGVLLVNVARVHVEANNLAIVPKTDALKIPALLKNATYRRALRDRLISNAVLGAKIPAGGITNAAITFANRPIQFRTHPLLKPDWQLMINARPPAQSATSLQVLNGLKQLAEDFLTQPALQATNAHFQQWFTALLGTDAAIGDQAIVVAGRTAKDVRILNNTAQGFLRGIHVALGQGPFPQTTPDFLGTVSITGNNLEIALSQDAIRRSRHGIFVGHCNSLLIENNFVRLNALPGTSDIAIQCTIIAGKMGKRLLFRNNHFVGFSLGLLFKPRAPIPLGPPAAPSCLWLIADNVFEAGGGALFVPATGPYTLERNVTA